jgi:RNA polymerase sigma-70 factor (ECF subfamily)
LRSLTDAELVARTQAGDVGAFNELASRWESALYGFARRTLGDAEDARDVCQDAFVKAYQNIRRLRDGEKFKSWIHYIALNLCRDRFRTPRARADHVPFEEGRDAGATATEPETESADRSAEAASLSALLGAALDRLPVEQRTSIVLREYQGLTSEEIGEIMGVPAATVRTRIFYGLKALRATLRAQGIEQADFT